MAGDGALTRRRLVGGAAVAAGAIVVGPGFLSSLRAQRTRSGRVVVVGGGLAGLTAAYELERAGFDVTILEARDRLGGRVHTIRPPFAGGQHAEAGGEYIDVVHHHMRRYCRRFGLALEDAQRGFGGLEDLGFRHGRRHLLGRLAGADHGSARYYRALYRLTRHLDPTDPVGTAPNLDRRSVADLLDAIGLDGRGRFAVESYIRDDYAAEPGRLSLLGVAAAERVYENVTEAEIERYRVHGGNSRLVAAFERRIAGAIHSGAPVETIVQEPGRITVSAGGDEYEAGWCVFAVPLPAARNVNLSAARLGATLSEAIAQLAYGRVTKNLVQYRRRFWRAEGFSGDLLSDLPLGTTWEATNRQPGRRGILIAYAAGARSIPMERAPIRKRIDAVRRELDRIYRTGIGPIGSYSVAWRNERFTGGAWAAPAPGQVTDFWSALRRPAGLIHLAGEHTDDLYPGYMEGAVRSGIRAAARIERAA
jgi:monoamine oxidase